MTGRLPSLKADAVIRALQRSGLEIVRSVGSHRRMVHTMDPKRATTVPMHKGGDLPRPLLRAIIQQVGLTEEEFLELL
jgi:predicted RNA binding protein YcfA (HicA-like mRNA interferase family)